jgi:phage terminase large subunit-like protein
MLALRKSVDRLYEIAVALHGDHGRTERAIWRPQPGPQTTLIESTVPDILFGGARGGGKTDAVLGDFLMHAKRYGKYARGLILRRTMPQLDEVIRRSHEIYTGIAEYRYGSKTWIFQNGAILRMRWLDRDADADNYQGHSNTYIAIDEAGTWPIPDGIDKLRATLRSADGVPCLLRLTANPGGTGQIWLRERYVAPSPAGVPFRDEAASVERLFIPSGISDNKILLQNDPGYIDRIRSSGPPWLVRAWLDGDWNSSSGEAFFDERYLLGDQEPFERCAYVYAVMDTAIKSGAKHDGTAVVYFAYEPYGKASPLQVVDWDIKTIDGASLIDWMPTIFQNLERLAKEMKARHGSVGVWIEDKASGSILLQQAKKRGFDVSAIDAKITAMGKDERALNVSGYHYQGLVKIARPAYDKVVTYKGQTRNHFLSQVCGFKLGMENVVDDLLDCYTYGLAASLGDSKWN